MLLNQPADPDLFLDDQDVLAENTRTDYMPFWAFLWPTAMQMARCVQLAPWPTETRVLELGAGLGLVGLSCMARGNRVVFSDYDPTALHLCRVNAFSNQMADPEVLRLDWREPASEKFDVILGCEVTYDAPMHPVLLDLLESMLTPNGLCWLADPGRYQSPFFYKMALDRGFTIRILDEDLNELSEPRSQGFQIFELQARCKQIQD